VPPPAVLPDSPKVPKTAPRPSHSETAAAAAPLTTNREQHNQPQATSGAAGPRLAGETEAQQGGKSSGKGGEGARGCLRSAGAKVVPRGSHPQLQKLPQKPRAHLGGVAQSGVVPQGVPQRQRVPQRQKVPQQWGNPKGVGPSQLAQRRILPLSRAPQWRVWGWGFFD